MSRKPSQFERAVTIFRPNGAVLHQATSMYQQFLQNNEMSPQYLPSLAEVSVFVAEALQEVKDLKGRKFSGIGMALSRLIGHCARPQVPLQILSKFIKCVSLESQNLAEIEHYLVRAKASYQFMVQFERYLKQLQLVEVDPLQNNEYGSIFTELAWMLYIDSKENFLKWDSNSEWIDKCRCLLACVFYFMVRYSLDYIYPKQLKRERNYEKRTIVGKILELILQLFDIANIQMYKTIAAHFDEYVYNLIDQFVIRSVGSDTDFFSPSIIHFNYKQIQNRYQKNLRPRDLDLRVFRNQRSITPIHKEALFYRVGNKKHDGLTRSMTRDYKSHRILYFDEPQLRNHKLQINSLQPNTQESIVERSCSSGQSAAPQRVNIQIYKCVKALKKGRKLDLHRKETAQVQISNMVKKIQPSLALNRQSFELTVYSIYEALSTEIFETEAESVRMTRCLLAISLRITETMYYVQSNSESLVAYVQDESTQSLIDIWYCLHLLTCGGQLPPSLLKQFGDQKQQIICQLIWKGDGYIDQIAELAAKYPKQELFIIFSQNLVLYAQSFYLKLAAELGISKSHCVNAYNCFKFILTANGSLLRNRHLDQILLCSVYIAGKISCSNILFTTIRQAYQTLNNDNPRKCQKIFNCALLEENQVGDIIRFYNTQFLHSVQPFVPYMANPSLNLFHPLFQRQIQLQYQQQRSYSVNAVISENLLQTKKPSHPFVKVSKEKVNQNFSFFAEAERNQTRVRVRPSNFTNNQNCNTERMKTTQQELKYTRNYQ